MFEHEVKSIRSVTSLALWQLLCGVQRCVLCAVALTDKEAVLFLTRLAALDNAMAAVGSAREQWQTTFLDLLYTMCTRVVPPHVCSALWRHVYCHQADSFSTLFAHCTYSKTRSVSGMFDS